MENKFLLIINGGIGDFIPILHLINTLHECQFYILCLPKHMVLKKFIHNNAKIDVLTFKNLIAKFFFHRVYLKKFIYIRTSPIFEFYLLSFILNVKQQIGFIRSFNRIESIGYDIKYDLLKKYHDLPRNKVALIKYLTKLITDNQKINSYEVKPILKYLNIEKKHNFAVIAPAKSPGWEMGILDKNEYIKIASELINNNFEVVFIGFNSEIEFYKEKVNNSKIKFFNNLSFIELSNIIYNSNLVVSNDNGIAHLAAYFNKKQIVLYTFSNPYAYSWPNENYNVLFNPIYRCMPCTTIKNLPIDNYEFTCPYNIQCTTSLTTDIIRAKILNVLK